MALNGPLIDSRRADMGAAGRRSSTTGDIRLDKRTDWLLDQIVATHSLVLRELGETAAVRLRPIACCLPTRSA